MIQVRPGPGGYRSKTSLRIASAALVIISAGCIAALAGCSSKKEGQTTAAAPTGLGEQSMNRSSLEQFQKGTLGGENGPLTDIHFDYNDFTIRAQDGEILRANARWLSAHSETKVQAEGHCDERGSEDYNIALGAKRAQAAKDYLVTLGIAGSRISTISYGKELPLCTDHNETCWARNRRAHFVVSQ